MWQQLCTAVWGLSEDCAQRSHFARSARSNIRSGAESGAESLCGPALHGGKAQRVCILQLKRQRAGAEPTGDFRCQWDVAPSTYNPERTAISTIALSPDVLMRRLYATASRDSFRW